MVSRVLTLTAPWSEVRSVKVRDEPGVRQSLASQAALGSHPPTLRNVSRGYQVKRGYKHQSPGLLPTTSLKRSKIEMFLVSWLVDHWPSLACVSVTNGVLRCLLSACHGLVTTMQPWLNHLSWAKLLHGPNIVISHDLSHSSPDIKLMCRC